MFLPLFWARIYGCLNSVEKLRSVSPSHKQRGDGCASRFATEERTNIRQLFITITMPSEQHFLNKTDEMIEKYIEECEKEAAKLEVTVDYYLAEFV